MSETDGQQTQLDRAGAPPSDEETKRRAAFDRKSAGVVVTTGIVLIAAALVALFQVWSDYEVATSDDPPETIDLDLLWFIGFGVSAGTTILIVVAIGGMLGGTLTGVRNAAGHRAGNGYDSSYNAYYAVRPFLGASIALVLYLVLSGGLIGVDTGDTQLNKFGIAGLAILGGLFSKNAFEKLSELFSTIFAANTEQRQFDSMAKRLRELDQLHDDGVLDDGEFAAAKQATITAGESAPGGGGGA